MFQMTFIFGGENSPDYIVPLYLGDIFLPNQAPCVKLEPEIKEEPFESEEQKIKKENASSELKLYDFWLYASHCFRKESWKEEEDEKLIVKRLGQNKTFQQIATQIPGRTEKMCSGRYKRLLNQQHDKQILYRIQWSESDKEKIINFVNQNTRPRQSTSNHLYQQIFHWLGIVSSGWWSVNWTVMANLFEHLFNWAGFASDKEKTRYKEEKINWKTIAKQIKGRNTKQVKEYYENYLREGISHQEWSPLQDYYLGTLYKQLGNKPASIEKHMYWRSKSNLQNRINGRILPVLNKKKEDLKANKYHHKLEEMDRNLIKYTMFVELEKLILIWIEIWRPILIREWAWVWMQVQSHS